MGIFGDVEILIPEYWNDGIGMMEYWNIGNTITLLFHHSITSSSYLPYLFIIFYTFS
jgi:hypothetical protein